jgi:hypothetical protein
MRREHEHYDGYQPHYRGERFLFWPAGMPIRQLVMFNSE